MPLQKELLSRLRVSSRLLRYYIGGLVRSKNGACIVIGRDGLYRALPGETIAEKVFAITRGSRPLNILLDPEDRVIFGEYGSNPDRHDVKIFVSDSLGKNFEVAYSFEAGDVRHVHNVLYDPFVDGYWVFVGDYDSEPGIALFDRNFCNIEWVQRGRQDVRVVSAFIEEDALIYGTDTEIEANFIKRLDKATGQIEIIQAIDGSSLFAARFGAVKAISTCVEPSSVNSSRAANIYISLDGQDWSVMESTPKDALHPIFQYGTYILPTSDFGGSIGMISGQALSGADNRVGVLEFTCST